MGYVTKDQIERARQVDILSYILSYESGNVLLKQKRFEKKVRNHE
jgi:hypothetical protein